jgi:hypothetical protein
MSLNGRFVMQKNSHDAELEPSFHSFALNLFPDGYSISGLDKVYVKL